MITSLLILGIFVIIIGGMLIFTPPPTGKNQRLPQQKNIHRQGRVCAQAGGCSHLYCFRHLVYFDLCLLRLAVVLIRQLKRQLF